MILPVLPVQWADMIPGEWGRLRRAALPLEMVGAAVVAEWEDRAAKFLGLPCAAALSSKRRALQLVLEHLRIGPGDEVIVPAYGSTALVRAVLETGAAAVPAEVALESFQVTAASVADRVSPRTRLVIVSHLFGAPAPVDEIVDIAGERGITVVEDCAQALGARLNGRRVGALGYAAIFGLGPFDPVNTHGGALVASHDTALGRFIHGKVGELPHEHVALARRVAALRRDRCVTRSGLLWLRRGLITASGEWGGDAGIGPDVPPAYAPVQAALGMAKMATLAERLAHRRRMAALLASLLGPDIRLQRTLPGAEPVWSRCVALLPCRAAPVARRMLLRRAVVTATGDAIAADCARMTGRADCPNAVDLQPNLIALPFFDAITPAQIRRAARALNDCLAR